MTYHRNLKPGLGRERRPGRAARLVRHRGRADLARPHALPEVAQRHVAPQVAIKVQQHRVEARHRAEQLRDVVVRLDLRRAGRWEGGAGRTVAY